MKEQQLPLPGFEEAAHAKKEIYIMDTSSIISIKEKFSQEDQRRIFQKLGQFALQGTIKCPPQVLMELKSYEGPEDEPLKWIKNFKSELIVNDPSLYEKAKEILKRFPSLVDPRKSREQADPYVIALAEILREKSNKVIIVSEDIRSRKKKISIHDVCRNLNIPCIQIEEFLSKIES